MPSPGFAIDEGRGKIIFPEGAVAVSTVHGVVEGPEGAVFGGSRDGWLSLPAYGEISCCTLDRGASAVSAVVSAGPGSGTVRAGEEPAGTDGGASIVVLLSASVPIHTAARAIVTATEAVTALLRESGCGARSSATGFANQNVTVVCDQRSQIRLTDAGKHSVLGELIGRATMQALRQSSRIMEDSPRIARAAVRLGLDPSSIEHDEKLEAALLALLQIRDEIGWGFLPAEEGMRAARDIAAALYGIDASG